MPADVEVQIVSYNSWPLIAACLDSLQRYMPSADITVDVAVLDNASSDGTAENITRKYPNVRVLAQTENTYYGPACNTLVASSDARYVLLLNPDTELLDDIISPLVEVMERYPDAAAALPAVVDCEGRPQPVIQRFPTLSYELAKLLDMTKVGHWLRPVWDIERTVDATEGPRVPHSSPFQPEFIWSTCLLMRREVAARLGPFSPDFPMYDTDLDLSRRMSSEGLHVVYLPHLNVAHVGGASSPATQKIAMMRTARKRYFGLFHGPVAAFAYTMLTTTIDTGKRARTRAAAWLARRK